MMAALSSKILKLKFGAPRLVVVCHFLLITYLHEGVAQFFPSSLFPSSSPGGQQSLFPFSGGNNPWSSLFGNPQQQGQQQQPNNGLGWPFASPYGQQQQQQQSPYYNQQQPGTNPQANPNPWNPYGNQLYNNNPQLQKEQLPSNQYPNSNPAPNYPNATPQQQQQQQPPANMNNPQWQNTQQNQPSQNTQWSPQQQTPVSDNQMTMTPTVPEQQWTSGNNQQQVQPQNPNAQQPNQPPNNQWTSNPQQQPVQQQPQVNQPPNNQWSSNPQQPVQQQQQWDDGQWGAEKYKYGPANSQQGNPNPASPSPPAWNNSQNQNPPAPSLVGDLRYNAPSQGARYPDTGLSAGNNNNNASNSPNTWVYPDD